MHRQEVEDIEVMEQDLNQVDINLQSEQQQEEIQFLDLSQHMVVDMEQVLIMDIHLTMVLVVMEEVVEGLQDIQQELQFREVQEQQVKDIEEEIQEEDHIIQVVVEEQVALEQTDQTKQMEDQGY